MTADRESMSDNRGGVAMDLAEKVPEAVVHLKSAVRCGAPWYRALLEAVALWTLPHEIYRGRSYRYLIQGEALDWLLLAERLCAELDGLVGEQEREALLFNGKLPEEVTYEVFQDLIGATKHRAYLNYWYGVVIEEALQLAAEEEVRKTHRARCFPDSEDLVEEAFTHLYGKPRRELLVEFCLEARDPPGQRPGNGDPTELDLSLTDVKEFTYWLFKRRVNMWDPARVASDTRKGLRKLHQLEGREPNANGHSHLAPDFYDDANHPGKGTIDGSGRVSG